MAHRPQEVSNLRFLRSEVFAMAFKIQWRPRIMDAEFLPLLPLQGADTFRVPNLIGLRGCNVICDGLRPSMWMTLLYRVIYFACTNHHKLLRRQQLGLAQQCFNWIWLGKRRAAAQHQILQSRNLIRLIDVKQKNLIDVGRFPLSGSVASSLAMYGHTEITFMGTYIGSSCMTCVTSLSVSVSNTNY